MDFESEINDNIIIVELRIYCYAGKKKKIPLMTLLGQTLFPFCQWVIGWLTTLCD